VNCFSGRLIFDHLEKTGGTAITDWLINNFGFGCVSPHATGEYFNVIKEYGGMYPVITGHVYFRIDRHKLHPVYKHVTLLRDPIERAISYLKFISNAEASGSDYKLANFAKFYLENEGDIPEDIIEQSSVEYELLVQGLSNIYVKHFCAYVCGELSSVHVDLAESFLSEYDYVGFNHDMPSFLRAIEDLTGYRCENPIRQINVTPDNKNIVFFKSKKLINKLSEINVYDLALYQKMLLVNKKSINLC
jgi:hypothetical protein